VDSFALTPAERALFQSLERRGIRFVIIGMGAAMIEGAPVTTQDLDLWLEDAAATELPLAAIDAGGFWISGFGLQPPSFGGEGLDRVDVVLTAHGLSDFSTEYSAASEQEIEGVRLRVLSLERIIASKQATGRAKDKAAIPILEATLAAKRAPK